MFRDWEISFSYVLEREVALTELTLQAEEVSAVEWFDVEAVKKFVAEKDPRFCVTPQGLAVLTAYLAKEDDR